MRRKKIPGRSLFAARAHFLKGGPMEVSKAAKSRRKRRQNRDEERRVEKGERDF